MYPNWITLKPRNRYDFDFAAGKLRVKGSVHVQSLIPIHPTGPLALNILYGSKPDLHKSVDVLNRMTNARATNFYEVHISRMYREITKLHSWTMC